MGSKKIAEITSEVLGPLFWAPVLIAAFLLKGDLSFHQVEILLPLILIFQVIIPLLYIYYFSLKWHLASAWDEPKRRERYPLLILVSLCFFVSSLVVYKFGNLLLFHLEVLMLTSIFVTFLITLFWKISLHMGMSVVGSLLVNFLYGFTMPYLYLSIPIIYWARLKLKRHTKAQLLVSLLLNGGIIIVGLYVFGYLKT